MIDRRRATGFVLAAALLPALGVLASPPVRAQQSYQRFIPLLIELPGWQGNKPTGASLDMPGNSMVTAQREYRREAARLTAQILVGTAAQGAASATRNPLKIQTSDGRMNVSTIDGFPVNQSFTIRNKSGVIIVALADNAVFNLNFSGIEDDEALGLSKKFNWKTLQAAVK
jgi:hypothetical protein